MNKKKSNTNGVPKKLKVTNDLSTTEISDIKEMCNKFNDYFVSVGRNVASSIKLHGEEKNIINDLRPTMRNIIAYQHIKDLRP